MKPALYYAIDNHYRKFTIVAITTEKSSQWYGRKIPEGEPTNGALRNLVGRFNTKEQAIAKLNNIKVIERAHQPLIDAAQERYAAAERAMRDAIDKVLQDV